MRYGYCRVSSYKQLKQNGLEEQRQKLLSLGADEIVEEQFTGSTTNRPAFTELIKHLKPGDELMATRLDRIARNVEEGIRIIKDLMKKGVSIRIANLGVLENSPMGKFFVSTLLAVAELEKSMILERMQAGLEIARTKEGFREGRPPISDKKKDHAANLILKEGYTFKQASEVSGISKATLYRHVRHIRNKNRYILEGMKAKTDTLTTT